MALTTQEDMERYVIDLLDPISSQSDDIVVICKLIANELWRLLLLVRNMDNLIDIDSCPEQFLPYLGKIVGYTPSSGLTADQKRLALKYIIDMYQRRGTIDSIKKAVLLAGHTEMSLMQDVDTSVLTVEEGYGFFKINYSEDVEVASRYLEDVRPAGISYEYVRLLMMAVVIISGAFVPPIYALSFIMSSQTIQMILTTDLLQQVTTSLLLDTVVIKRRYWISSAIPLSAVSTLTLTQLVNNQDTTDIITGVDIKIG